MLYYDVAIWSDQCPSQRPCQPVNRINGTGLTDFNPATWNGNGHSTNGGGANGDGSFTYPGPYLSLASLSFPLTSPLLLHHSPLTPLHSSTPHHTHTHPTHPGPGGKPLGSIRLSNIADGIEDWELFNRLGATTRSISMAADLISQLVSNATVRTEDPRLLEKVRRQAAHRIMALQ
jgi:hypothetical protein